MNMRYLIHLMGDIHQPLHVINYYSEAFPNGDDSIFFLPFLFYSLDGKLFNIQLSQNTSAVTHDLHFFIDGCAGLFSDNRTLPFVFDNTLCLLLDR